MEYLKHCANLQTIVSPDGRRLYLRRGPHGRARSYPIQAGRLLLALDGWTRPSMSGMTKRQVWQWLCRFERDGFLEDLDLVMTAFGSLVLCFPCRNCRLPLAPLFWLYDRLIALSWLPLLGWLFWQVSIPYGLKLPHSSMEMREILLWSVVVTLFLLVLHELAHAAAAQRQGMPVSGFGFGLTLFMPCAVTYLQTIEYAPARVRRRIYAAGPQCNLAIGAAALLACGHLEGRLGLVIYLTGIVSLMMGFLNLMPIGPLDGARILRTFPAMDRILEGDWYGAQAFVLWGSYRVAAAAGLVALIGYQVISLVSIVEGVV